VVLQIHCCVAEESGIVDEHAEAGVTPTTQQRTGSKPCVTVICHQALLEVVVVNLADLAATLLLGEGVRKLLRTPAGVTPTGMLGAALGALVAELAGVFPKVELTLGLVFVALRTRLGGHRRLGLKGGAPTAQRG